MKSLDVPVFCISISIVAIILGLTFFSLLFKERSSVKLVSIIQNIFFIVATYYNYIIYFPLIEIFSFLCINGSLDTSAGNLSSFFFTFFNFFFFFFFPFFFTLFLYLKNKKKEILFKLFSPPKKKFSFKPLQLYKQTIKKKQINQLQ